MIKLFSQAWACNKGRLQEYFASNPQSEYDEYVKIWKAVIKYVINPHLEETGESLAIDKTVVLDDGDSQGTQILITPMDIYQPDASEYIITYVWYGSCSGCDTLLAISGYDDGIPTERQVSDYLSLALHLLQRAKQLLKGGFSRIDDMFAEEAEAEE